MAYKQGYCLSDREMATTIKLEDDNRLGLDSPTGIHDARKKGLPWLIAALIGAIFVLLLILLFFVLRVPTDDLLKSRHKSLADLSRSDWPALSPKSLIATFKKVAVVSDNGLCSEIGRSILLRGGNAIDAAIATSVCIGGLNSHSCGIGGGGLMTVYLADQKKCLTIDARETAPLATNNQTFVNNPKDAFTGYKSIATPGEVHGFWTAFKRYGSGRIAWQDLIMPTVAHLRAGVPATKLMETNLNLVKSNIENEPTMRAFFINNVTGELYKEGEIMKNPVLADTLQRLATSSDPAKLFYTGDVAQQIAAEIYGNDGFLTKQDLEQYRSIVDEAAPLTTGIGGENIGLCGPKPPSGFVVTQFLVAVMSKLYPKGSNESKLYNDDEFYHRFVEAQKYGYALRTQLGHGPASDKTVEKLLDPAFHTEIADKISKADKVQPESEYGAHLPPSGKHGTSHIGVVDAAGNAVSFTTSVNNVFGSHRRSPTLGIVWNDQMDDFSIPGAKNFYGFEPSEANFVSPGVRPMSSMSPLVAFDTVTGKVRVVAGAAGGSKIISTMSQFLLHVLSFNQTVKDAIDFPRIHNQFTPLDTNYEEGFPTDMIEALKKRGHNMTVMGFPFATIQAIVRQADGSLEASNDHRRPVYMNPAGYKR
uniref:Gamma-glutamyltranspeptidase 1 n=1 Tax=Panagrellus redivivus TaxID=6233 RepID=A0A7E4VUP2_PANRE